jgi:alkylation response protein AidB-like acyl-CoA dehydrogenase
VNLDETWYRIQSSVLDTTSLRQEVRAFLDVERDTGLITSQCNSWLDGYDPAFSRRLGQRGWLGLTWPTRYGGGGRSGLERYVVVEELLAAGAPVSAHWFAERQIGPSLLRFGNEELKDEFLPKIARGECYFSIGMSEPDSGSDLASVRTSAHRVNGGWRVSGQKMWTSHASRAHYMVTLCRTDEPGESRHAGLSQLIIDLHSDGVDIRPIELMNGRDHFAEVILDDVFVPEIMLLGNEGDGWFQVNAELAYERSGPERFLSPFPLIEAFVDHWRTTLNDGWDEMIGNMIANMWSLRVMSESVAGLLDQGSSPETEAALVKDLATTFESDVVDLISSLSTVVPLTPAPSAFSALLYDAILAAPTFTLRGGTTEILRGIISKAVLA